MSRIKIDLSRMLCPMPVIKTQNQVNRMLSGQELEITCTDPGALNDIPVWARINGHQILAANQTDDEVIITLKVGG
ncbi:MAG TPA: sulfurtransferase TusA family protein [Methylophaga aminisulfidivorans]|uniref:Sulfurtransferase TusA family protein n=2 Tax=root TaxID=1 RepID=A0A7C1ZQ37_9GAMM|nr:sulfurtransferase TusA family protein [Methylophaga aminisulfidivorans]